MPGLGAAPPAAGVAAPEPHPASLISQGAKVVGVAVHPKRDLAALAPELSPRAFTIAKLLRYSLASVVGVICGGVLLVVCNAGLGLSGVLSNFISVALSALPNYWMNRAWTWSKHDSHSFITEVLPFWLMAFAGLGLSTVFVAYADHRWHTTLAIVVANLLAFGLLWVVKFLILERLMFGRAARAPRA